MNWTRFKDLFTTYLFVIPALILFSIFSLYPFFKVFQLSVFEWDGISTADAVCRAGEFRDRTFP